MQGPLFARLCSLENNGGRSPRAACRPRRPQRLNRAIAACLLILTAGCAALEKPAGLFDGSMARRREERKQRAAAEFEAARNEAEYKSAMNLWDRNNLKGCEEALRSLIERVPAHREARLLLIDVCLAQNNLREAAEQAERLLADFPNDAQVHYSAALALDSLGRCDEALVHYQRAVSLAPDNEAYRAGYLAAREAAGRRRPKTPNVIADLAAAIAPAAIADEPAVRSTGHAIAETEPTGSRRTANAGVATVAASAGEGAGNAVFADPVSNDDRSAQSADDLIRQGRIALSEGNPNAAAELFRQAILRSPNEPRVILSAATAALRYEQPELAVQLLKAAAARFPQHAVIHQTLGLACYRLADYSAAQDALNRALSLDKSNALSYFLMGCTLAKTGQTDTAEHYLRQAEALDPRWTTRR